MQASAADGGSDFLNELPAILSVMLTTGEVGGGFHFRSTAVQVLARSLLPTLQVNSTVSQRKRPKRNERSDGAADMEIAEDEEIRLAEVAARQNIRVKRRIVRALLQAAAQCAQQDAGNDDDGDDDDGDGGGSNLAVALHVLMHIAAYYQLRAVAVQHDDDDDDDNHHHRGEGDVHDDLALDRDLTNEYQAPDEVATVVTIPSRMARRLEDICERVAASAAARGPPSLASSPAAPPDPTLPPPSPLLILLLRRRRPPLPPLPNRSPWSPSATSPSPTCSAATTSTSSGGRCRSRRPSRSTAPAFWRSTGRTTKRRRGTLR